MKRKSSAIYSFTFTLSSLTGKRKATKEKAEALNKIFRGRFRIVHPKKDFNLLSIIIADFSLAILILKNRPTYLILRGPIGFLATLIASVTNVYIIREIHSDQFQELKLIDSSFLKKTIIFCSYLFESFLCLFSKKIIYNNPILLRQQKNSIFGKISFWIQRDFCYNGYREKTYCKFVEDKYSLQVIKEIKITLEKLRSKNVNIVVFIGSMSKWHGINYLYELQNCFNKNKDNISIIFLGGTYKVKVPEGSYHIPCLSPSASDFLLSEADASLVPCNDIRTSPGSPLKLYDSIRNKCIIFAQKDLEGYSDEVKNLDVGLSVDFKNAALAREIIKNNLINKHNFYNKNNHKKAIWEERLKKWFF